MQQERESDREYLARWTELRNPCEGVDERQAIGYFTQGCRDTMLRHKLLCDEPAIMAELMTIVDKFATTYAAMRQPIRVDGGSRLTNGLARGRPAEDHD